MRPPRLPRSTGSPPAGVGPKEATVVVLTTAVFAAGTAGWIALAVVLVAAGGEARSSWAWS